MTKRFFSLLTLILIISAAATAATVNTTLTVDATATLSLTTGALTATGTATLPNVGPGTGTFSATVNISTVTGANATAPFTITMAGATGGTLTGTLTIPVSLFLGSSTTGSGSAAITGGTGGLAGTTGTFPTVTGTGSGSVTSSITLHFNGAGTVTTGSSGGGGTTPTITAVLDAGSYTKNIAQGSIFVVKGSNLSASGFTQLSFPLPTSNSGVKITLTPTGGGAGTDAYLIYLYNQGGVNQLAAVLPSTLATGNYNVTVTNGTAVSANFAATVVARKPGLITQDSTGTGLAVVQNFVSATQLDINRFSTGNLSGFTISPAKPGQILIAWATGLGAQGPDNSASPGHDFLADRVDIKAIVGGMTITPLYAGRAPGLAGADQINFALPANVPTGCSVSFQISVAGQLSNATFISIAPSNSASACVSPTFTTAQLQRFDQGGTYSSGIFTLSQIAVTVPQVGNAKINNFAGAFTKYTGFQLASAETGNPTATPTGGACTVTPVTSTNTAANTVSGGTVLDGGILRLTGPAGSGLTNVTVPKDASTGGYVLSLGTEGFPALPGGVNATLVAGKYNLHGEGGVDVGSFDASVTLGAPLTIAGGLPSTVNRSGGLRLAWTGGNSTDIVIVNGVSSVSSGTAPNITVSGSAFTCITTAGAGGITVGSDILNQLSPTASGSLAVFSVVSPAAGNNGVFTAPLTAGGSIDIGLFLSEFGIANTPAYQ